MENIVIGFSKAKGFVPYSWLIMAILRTPFSHVHIKIHSAKYNRDIIYQASSTMVNFSSVPMFDAHHTMVAEFSIPISDETKTKVMQFALDNAGVPYGTKAALGMGLVKLCAVFGKKIRNPFRDSRQTYVCSELAATILIDFIGANINSNDIDEITPADVYNYLINNADKI